MRAFLGFLALVTIGCTVADRGPEGSWVLQGHGVSGGLVGDGESLEITLQGATWSTGSDPVAAKRVADEDGSTWLYFPVRTAAGEAEAALQLDLDAGSARLPLGFRDGEHVYSLTVAPGTPPALEPALALADLQRAWTTTGFALHDSGGALAGTLVLAPNAPARVQLISAAAITQGSVPAMRKAEGPDLLMVFAVEPQFADELGLLRLNLPTMKAVLPVDRAPHPGDRWLDARAGLPDDAALEARLGEVREQALKAERELLTRLSQELSGAALAQRAERGRCPTVEELQPEWRLLLEDYRLTVDETAGDCVIGLEPHMVQHTRRVAIRASAQGVHSLEVLGGE
jgi:hypothetical protein